MNVLTLQQLERNAYRTLGLPASATQVQIDAAARMLRLTACDAPGAGAADPLPGRVRRSGRWR